MKTLEVDFYPWEVICSKVDKQISLYKKNQQSAYCLYAISGNFKYTKRLQLFAKPQWNDLNLVSTEIKNL